MQLVTFARSVPPYGKGDKRLVPDEVALALLDSGDAAAAENWPPQEKTAAPEKSQRPTISVRRPFVKAADRTAR